MNFTIMVMIKIIFLPKNCLWIAKLYVTGFTKTVPIGTRNEIQFIADY